MGRGLAPLVAVLGLAGCPTNTSWPPPGGGGEPYPYPYVDGGYYPGQACVQDSDCPGASTTDAGASPVVCARDGMCVPAADVVTVHVLWTLQGQAAGSASCASSPDLEISFSGTTGYGYGYAPVPCVEGEFTINKLENTYTFVELDTVNNPNSGSGANIPPGGGTVTLNLPY